MNRKIFFVLIFACFLQVNVYAQEKWDSTYRPGSFELMTGLFESYPNASTDIIFFGNSITAHLDWNELLACTRHATVVYQTILHLVCWKG